MHGSDCLFTQELSMLLAHQRVTNFTTRPGGGHLLEVDFSDLVSKMGGTSFSVVALIPADYPNASHRPILSPVDRDGSLSRDLLMQIAECLADSVQVAQGCPAILCALSGVASILRDAGAEDTKTSAKAIDSADTMQLTKFMRSELRKRPSEPGSGSSAETTASSCPSIKGWLAENPYQSDASSSNSDSESDDECDVYDTTDDEPEMKQVQWELSANIARKILRMKECRMAAE